MRKKVLKSFVFLEPEDFFDCIDQAIGQLAGPIKAIAQAFKNNLQTANRVASIPYLMANAAVQSRRFQALASANRIRSLKTEFEGIPEDERIRDADKRALEQLEAESSTKERRKALVDGILRDLSQALEDPEFNRAASELLRQTVVMIWGSLEVLAFDASVCLVNRCPDLAIKLISGEETKRYFPRGVRVEDLAKHDYDLTSTMGEVLFSQMQTDSVSTVKHVFSVLIADSEEIERRLSDKDIWVLFQQRHLIVHRRGIVDQAYLAKTPGKAEAGSELFLNSDVVDQYFVLVRDIGLEMLNRIRAEYFTKTAE